MADRYWVGGTGSWDTNIGTKWATTSGGAGGASVPTAADNVFFDAASGAGTVTVFSSCNCLSLNFTGFTGIITGNININISGSLTVSSGMSWSHTATLVFNSTTTGNTITTNGKYIGSTFRFNGLGGAWTLVDNLSTLQLDLLAGSFITNNNNITTSTFTTSGTLTRSLNLGSSTITLTASGTAWSFSNSTGLTLTAGTSSIITTSASGPSFNGGGLTYYRLAYTGTPSLGTGLSISDSNTFTTLELTPTTSWATLTLFGNQTVTGTFQSIGPSFTQRNYVRSNAAGTARIITAAAINIQDTDFEDITGAGAAAPWAASSLRIGNCGGNSGISFPTQRTYYYNSSSGWADSSNGASTGNTPLVHDTIRLDAFSPAYSISTYPRMGTIDCTGYTNTLTIFAANPYIYIYGSFICSTTMVLSGWTTQPIYFRGRGSYTITQSGKSFATTTGSLLIDARNGTYILGSNLSVTGSTNTATLNIRAGTFSASSYNVTLGLFTCNVTGTRTINMGSGTWTIKGGSWTIATPAQLTINKETANIVIDSTTDTSFIFTGGTGYEYNNLTIAATSATTTFTSASNLTVFNTFTTNKTTAHTIQFNNGVTNTFTNFVANGSPGNLINLTSSTGATLVKFGGGTITVNYANISNLTASPASTWFATNSIDNGGNNGWTITTSPKASLFFGSNF